MSDLKNKAVRGAFAKACGQGISLIVRLVFIMVVARLIDPADFGLVAMVTVVTRLYGLFTSAGLAEAAVQSLNISDQQMSGLFWCNILIGTLLGVVCLLTAPILVFFYQEPRLFWITVVIAAGFVITAAGTQHNALLQRQLRYFSLTLIDGFSEFLGFAIGITMAWVGCGYWALVGTAIVAQAASTACLWLTTQWVPLRPQWAVELRSLLHFGGTITLNGLVVYVAYNFEKLLLGRFWGADALGIYGGAYQLVNLPTQNLNSAVGGVAFSALSRLQHDCARFKSYFLNSYSVLLSITVILTMGSMVFANDVVLVALGPNWSGAAVILRLLAPTILIFGIINPLAWLLLSTGLQQRSLTIAIVIAPLVISAYGIGLPYGPGGVAFAYSTVMALWLVPHVMWCLHGTIISLRDVVSALKPPFVSGIIAAFGALILQPIWSQLSSPVLRLGLSGSVMLLLYLSMLLYGFGQKAFYRDLLREMRGGVPSAADPRAV